MPRKSKKPVRKQTHSPTGEGVVGRVGQILLPMIAGIAATKADLTEWVYEQGLTALHELLRKDAEEIVGAKGKHEKERTHNHWGSTDGELSFGGRRIQVSRPRVRAKSGKEASLPHFEAFREEDPLPERVLNQILVGVSTRGYESSLDKPAAQLKSRGTSKSAASRHLVSQTSKKLEEYLARRLEELELAALMMDGLEVAGQTVVVTLNSAGQERVIGERQTAAEFDKPEYRFLVVANKFQTGFDQPLLHTMYVDKKLGGVNAVQTLSRLNRTHPGKKGAMVLDFANEAEEIRKAFEPYYETTLLSEETDPNLLYEFQGRLLNFGVFMSDDVETFGRVYFDPKSTQDRLYAALEPARQRFVELAPAEGRDFRGQLTDYVRLYVFLSQVLRFADPDLEKLYVFARHLRRLLPASREELPREVQQNIDMESFRIQQMSRGRIPLERQVWPLEPVGSKLQSGVGAQELEALSRIIEALNERFGLNLGPEHRVTLEHIRSALDEDAGLDASARVNTRENVRLTFDPKVEDKIQEIVETNFELYKRITDDPDFGRAFKNFSDGPFRNR